MFGKYRNSNKSIRNDIGPTEVENEKRYIQCIHRKKIRMANKTWKMLTTLVIIKFQINAAIR